MNPHRVSIGLTIIIALAAAVGTARAQVLYGALTGDVSDSSNAAIPAVHVEALNVSTGVSRETTTDSRGTYLFSNLQAGAYRVTISARGFVTSVREAVNVQINTTVRLDTQLGVAGRAEAVTVAADAVAKWDSNAASPHATREIFLECDKSATVR